MADEKTKEKSSWGGFREGSGRKIGGENKETKDRRIAERKYKERVVAHLDEIFNAQLNLATGLSFLIRIDEVKNKNGTTVKKHRIVESKTEIVDVLDGLDGSTHGEVDDSYYYISVRPPNNSAAESLIDRALGKVKQALDHKVEIDVGQLSEYKALSSEHLIELAKVGVDERTEESES